MMDGYVVYQGKAKESTSYFAQLGHICPTMSNPADFYMKILSVNYPKGEEEEKKIGFLMSSYNEKLAPKVMSNPKSV